MKTSEVSTSFSSRNSNNISPLERQALQDLYDSTDGPNWDYGYGGTRWDFFNPYSNPCNEHWNGIECSVDYHVVELSLASSNLRGTIPSSIGQLSYLVTLYLHNNQLSGTIPSTISQLSSLYYLYLHFNQLTGEVPSSLCQQVNYYFLFQNNQLLCYPECLTSRVQYLNAGSTPVCRQPSAQPTSQPSGQPSAQPIIISE
jgi:hypothetical protein